jgi:hypothetical protein
MTERSNAVSAMCQQLSQGLSLLSSTDDPFLTEDTKVTLDVLIVLVESSRGITLMVMDVDTRRQGD